MNFYVQMTWFGTHEQTQQQDDSIELDLKTIEEIENEYELCRSKYLGKSEGDLYEKPSVFPRNLTERDSYIRLIHPTQEQTDNLEDGKYDIVYSNGGWFFGTIKNSVYHEGKYIYPDKVSSMSGLFNSKNLELREGIFETKDFVDEGTFIYENTRDFPILHGKKCKRTYKQTGIVYTGEINNSLFNPNEPVNGTFSIPENVNLTFEPSTEHHGWWVYTFPTKKGYIKRTKEINYDRNVISIPKSIIEYRDGCVSNEYDMTFIYPEGYKGFATWDTGRLRHWFSIKFPHVEKNVLKCIRKKHLTGEIMLNMTNDHFDEIGIRGLDLYIVKTEIAKIS